VIWCFLAFRLCFRCFPFGSSVGAVSLIPSFVAGVCFIKICIIYKKTDKSLTMDPNLCKKALARNLRRIRKAKKLSTTEIAEILGTSQARVSYLEHEKGTLSAVDVALLSRSLAIPLEEFFQDLSPVDETGGKQLTQQLIRFGANALQRPLVVTETQVFEDVFVKSLAFLDETSVHHAFHGALLSYLADHELRFSRIYAQIGSNPFLLNQVLEELYLALEVLRLSPKSIQWRIRGKAEYRLGIFIKRTKEALEMGNWKTTVMDATTDSETGSATGSANPTRTDQAEVIAAFISFSYPFRFIPEHHQIYEASRPKRSFTRTNPPRSTRIRSE
jgi:transcriptional regulator with XRE-family HTH domain